jgi:glycosyl transferase family 61
VVQTFDDVLVNYEALIFRRGRIYPESFVLPHHFAATHYRRPSRYAWFLVKNYWLRKGFGEEPSALWVIDNYTPKNYYHWMIDALPRVLHAEQEGVQEGTVVLPRYYCDYAYIPFTLRAFPMIQRIKWLPARSKTRVRHLSFVPRQTGRDLISQIQETARRLIALSGEPGKDRRIYFTREGAAWRRIRNEAEVVRVMREHDVRVFKVDPSRPWEQVQAAAGADLVIGVHGAQLTNLMFMRPGGRLLELRHPYDDVFFEIYGPLAQKLGFGYERLDCEPLPTTDLPVNEADLMVDLGALREQLR